jgi:8-hydroxy-5-deazaflavin:NADPH oxidoreductase
MRIAVLGTGMVGRTLGSKLRDLGHDVTIGSRTASDEASTFADAAAGAEVVINATAGAASLEALEAAGADNLTGKLLIDVANPLGTSGGTMTLTVCNTDSLGEQIQRAFPDARVVKTLNTVNADVMVDPSIVPGSYTLFVAGDDADAKRQAVDLLESFGWSRDDVLDLGDITAARGMEAYLLLWLRLFGSAGTAHLNANVIIGK